MWFLMCSKLVQVILQCAHSVLRLAINHHWAKYTSLVNSNVLFNDNYWQTKMSRILFKSIYNSQTSLSLFNIPGDTASGSC